MSRVWGVDGGTYDLPSLSISTTTPTESTGVGHPQRELLPRRDPYLNTHCRESRVSVTHPTDPGVGLTGLKSRGSVLSYGPVLDNCGTVIQPTRTTYLRCQTWGCTLKCSFVTGSRRFTVYQRTSRSGNVLVLSSVTGELLSPGGPVLGALHGEELISRVLPKWRHVFQIRPKRRNLSLWFTRTEKELRRFGLLPTFSPNRDHQESTDHSRRERQRKVVPRGVTLHIVTPALVHETSVWPKLRVEMKNNFDTGEPIHWIEMTRSQRGRHFTQRDS